MRFAALAQARPVASMLNSGLDEHLREWAVRPFAWGASDCGLFVDAWARRVTGKPFFPPNTIWHDEETAKAAISGFGGWPGLARSILLPRTREPMAGDVVLARVPGGASFGIQATRGPVFLSGCGIVRTNQAKIIRAWRIDPS